MRREELRDNGWLVWSASWDDVIATERAWKEHVGAAVVASAAWPRGAVSFADAHFPAANVRGRVAGNPIDTLLAFLADPDPTAWRQAVRAAVLGWGRHATQTHQVEALGRIGDPDSALAEWLPAGHVGDDITQSDANIAFSVQAAGGLRVLLATTDPPDGRMAAGTVLPDVDPHLEGDDHRTRWRSWLHLSNALQFLASEGDSHAMTVDSLTSAPPPPAYDAAPRESGAEVSPDEVVVDAVRTMAQAAVDLGAPIELLVGGFETNDGLLVEAAWPHARVGVIAPEADDEQMHRWASDNDWDVRTPDAWDPAELATLIKDRI